MSHDSGSEQRQRTVAELLAQYGEAGSAAEPKRRRRRADDATEDTAPQAIIDRVLSDSGRMRPVSPAEDGTDEQAEPQQQPAQQQPPQQQLPQQPPQPDGPRPAQPVRPTRRARRAPTRFGAPVEPPSDDRQTQQQPAVPPAGQPQPGSQPPAQPQPPAASASSTHPAMQPATTTQQQPPVGPPANRTQQQPPVVPPGSENGSSLRSRLGGSAAEPHTEQLPAITDDEAPGPQPAGLREDSTLTRNAGEQNLEETQYGIPPLQEDDEDLDEYADEYADEEFSDEDYAEDGDFGYFEDSEAAAEEDEAEQAGSTGKDWLVLVGLIGASVLGGAAVWLGFDWLWGQIPAAALVGALVVIAGMVWIVRRVRNDDDLQTTVFSVLVGLIVTVSPAALLLLKH